MLQRSMPWLHFYLDFGNLSPLLNEFVGETWQHLSQLNGDCAAIGVDNNFPQFVIGHVARFGQIVRRDFMENALQFDQPFSVRGKTRQVIG